MFSDVKLTLLSQIIHSTGWNTKYEKVLVACVQELEQQTRTEIVRGQLLAGL